MFAAVSAVKCSRVDHFLTSCILTVNMLISFLNIYDACGIKDFTLFCTTLYVGFLPCTVPTMYHAHQLARLPVQRWGFESYWPVRRLIYRPQTKTGSVWSRRQTSKWCTGKPDPSNLYQVEGWWPALTGVETYQWSTTHHLDPPDLSWHGCYSDWGPAASGGQTVLANNRNGRRLQLIASRHYYYYYPVRWAADRCGSVARVFVV